MLEEERIDPRHGSVRRVLRMVGPITVGVGALLVVIGFGSFFSTFSSFGEGGPGAFGPPRYFWCAFVGIPLLAIGGALCIFGFMGAVVRYQAGAVAPVGKDAINYLAEGTQEGVRTVASAVAAGLAAGAGNAGLAASCPKCGGSNDANAKFCKQCGSPLSTTCPSCGRANDADAKFCDHCGAGLTG